MPASVLLIHDIFAGLLSGRLALYFFAVVSIVALKRYIFPQAPQATSSSVSELPGPLCHSWISGNLAQMFSSLGLNYHEELLEKYGRVSCVHGLLGVSAGPYYV
jgi:hypothetical protein